MLEMNHDCNRVVAIILVLVMYGLVCLMAEWPTIKRVIEHNRRAKRHGMYLDKNWKKGNYR